MTPNHITDTPSAAEALEATAPMEGEIVTRGTEVLATDPDLGASTVEYAIVLLAAAAFGGVMAAVIASDTVSELLMAIINKALGI
ncbi:DUF4244 domain-containing protein [Kocuria sp. JC486]|uniref:DUF4244 domain-containing protein n=1 Tax=Kocuria soli TaxID=2485125 RepID=A0A3N3ZTD9_9MICC|nr:MULTISPECIES: DUF4244 domain-containing protein [Kocuria]NHU84633.1 DUF4244 domain-containing protein [Kocuria sp. JC486]ROZ65591.1 DUF4244 domain-containing protein [Kocuria soli]